MFEGYSEKARRVIFFARYEASQYGSSVIEAEHILLGIMRESPVLNTVAGDPKSVAQVEIRLREELDLGRPTTSTSVDLPLGDQAKLALMYAGEEAARLNQREIRPEHLFLAVLRCGSRAAQILEQNGITLEHARLRIAQAGVPLIPPPGSLHSTVRHHTSEGCVEFLEAGEQVALIALRLLEHVPRVGELVELEDPELGPRQFRVRDVFYRFEQDQQAGGYRAQRLEVIVIHIQRVEQGTATDRPT